jgi:HlyD family secretion protein
VKSTPESGCAASGKIVSPTPRQRSIPSPRRRPPTAARGGRRARGAGVLLIVGLAPTVVAGCGGDSFDPGPTAQVERGRIERIVVATGTIEPEREVEVRPRIAGIVERILVEAGDEVEVGQPLIEIERELLEAQVREAEAALREARVSRRYAKIELDRIEELQAGGAASPQQLDDARSRYERAQAAEARARAGLDTLSTQLGYASVASPLSGRVLHVYTEEGNAVSPVTSVTGGTLLLSLAGTESLYLEGKVDENEVARVELDQEARIRTEAYGDRVFRGHVTKIAPIGERIQNVTYFEVEIEIADVDAGLLRPRMSGDAEIVAEVVEDTLAIPETALRYRGDRIYVEVVTGDGSSPVEARDVSIGIVDGTRVQILKGLEEGDEVRLQ